MTAIRTENLRYVYGPGTPFEKVAVDDFTVSIEQGAFVGVIGQRARENPRLFRISTAF
jgi:energy-coupling factor transport system ATP-binding protein